MDQMTPQLLFRLLSFAVRNKALPENAAEQYTAQRIKQIYTLATRHDVGNIVDEALFASGLSNQLAENSGLFQKLQLEAVMRYEKSNYELNRICEVLEEAKVPYMPLKGSVLRNSYPVPWMRTSCDIDILVPADQVDKAAAFLVEHLRYSITGKTGHDIGLQAKNGQTLELHYDLIEDSCSQHSAEVLRTVWEDASLANDSQYRYEMSDSMFYFYHIAHMAKHFEYGGCGIRPFVDLWILDARPGADEQGRDALLREGKLLQFANSVRKLSRVWLEEAAADADLEQLQEYILTGGMYGSLENWVKVKSEQVGGKKNYFLSRLFLTYNELRFAYPVLEKKKWLFPVIQVVRWFKIFNPNSRKKVKDEIRYSRNTTEATRLHINHLLTFVGLEDKNAE